MLPEVLAFAKAAGQSPSGEQQQAACLVLAVVAEGACEAVRKRINEVLQVHLCPKPTFKPLSYTLNSAMAPYCIVLKTFQNPVKMLPFG